MPVWTRKPDKVHGFLVWRGHLGSVRRPSAPLTLHGFLRRRRGEPRTEWRWTTSAARSKPSRRSWATFTRFGGKNSQPKIAPFASAQRLMSPSLLHGVHRHPAGWRRGGWRRELLFLSLFPALPFLTSSRPLTAEKRHPHGRAERSLQTPAASAGLSGFSPHCRCSEMKLLHPPNTFLTLTQTCM